MEETATMEDVQNVASAVITISESMKAQFDLLIGLVEKTGEYEDSFRVEILKALELQAALNSAVREHLAEIDRRLDSIPRLHPVP